MYTANPLLSAGDLPAYSLIKAEHVGPVIDQVLADNRQSLARLRVKLGKLTRCCSQSG